LAVVGREHRVLCGRALQVLELFLSARFLLFVFPRLVRGPEGIAPQHTSKDRGSESGYPGGFRGKTDSNSTDHSVSPHWANVDCPAGPGARGTIVSPPASGLRQQRPASDEKHVGIRPQGSHTMRAKSRQKVLCARLALFDPCPFFFSG